MGPFYEHGAQWLRECRGYHRVYVFVYVDICSCVSTARYVYVGICVYIGIMCE